MSEPASEGDADEPGQTDTGNARHSRAGHGQTQDGRSQTQSYPDGQGDTPTHRQTGKQTNRDKGTVSQIQTETKTEA